MARKAGIASILSHGRHSIEQRIKAGRKGEFERLQLLCPAKPSVFHIYINPQHFSIWAGSCVAKGFKPGESMIIQRIPTGIPKFDELLEGGFPTNSMMLLVGYPGAGKTTFAAQFVFNGAIRHRARGVYVCFAETKETFLRNMLRFGWDFERLEQEGLVAILDLSVTREAGLQKNLDKIMETMASLNASRLVVDSFSAVSMGLKEPIDIRVMVHLLYKFLKKANCVSILVIDQPWGSLSIGEGVSEFLADGIIHLETYFDRDEMFRRRLRILKMRGTNHAKLPCAYDITSQGFVILSTEGRKPGKRTRRKTTKKTSEMPAYAKSSDPELPGDQNEVL